MQGVSGGKNWQRKAEKTDNYNEQWYESEFMSVDYMCLDARAMYLCVFVYINVCALVFV
jgi:hypothetical protein